MVCQATIIVHVQSVMYIPVVYIPFRELQIKNVHAYPCKIIIIQVHIYKNNFL